SLVPKDWIRDFMARPSYGQSGDEFVERLDRDEPSTANLDGLELPSGNEFVGAGAAEPELKRRLLDRQQAWHCFCITGLSVVHGRHGRSPRILPDLTGASGTSADSSEDMAERV